MQYCCADADVQEQAARAWIKERFESRLTQLHVSDPKLTVTATGCSYITLSKPALLRPSNQLWSTFEC